MAKITNETSSVGIIFLNIFRTYLKLLEYRTSPVQLKSVFPFTFTEWHHNTKMLTKVEIKQNKIPHTHTTESDVLSVTVSHIPCAEVNN